MHKNCLLDWHTNFPQFQEAQPDHMQVKSLSGCFSKELVSFVRPRELEIAKCIWIGRLVIIKIFCSSGPVCVNLLWNGCRTTGIWEAFGKLCLTLKILINGNRIFELTVHSVFFKVLHVLISTAITIFHSFGLLLWPKMLFLVLFDLCAFWFCMQYLLQDTKIYSSKYT